MKEIILGPIPDNFDPSLHIPISPACFIGKEGVYDKWEELDFEPDPFKSIEDMSFHVDLTTQFSKGYLDKITETLNRLNSSNYTEKYWELLVFPWLLTLAQSTWERQLRLDKFIEKYSDQRLNVVLVKDTINWDFIDTLSHQQTGLLMHEYNYWLYSRLLENRIPGKWSVQWIDIVPPEQYLSKSSETVKQKLLKIFADNILASTVYGVDRFTSLLFEIVMLLRARIERSTSSNKLSFKPFHSNLDWSLDWDRLVESTLPRCFKKIGLSRVKTYIWRRTYLVGPILWYNENKKRKLANAVDNGCNLIVVQHGGSYGTSRLYSLKKAIEYDHHRFISWGWTEQGEHAGNILPLPAPLLSKFKHKTSGEKVILVTTRAMMYSYRIAPIPQAKQQINYRKSKEIFIEHLSKAVYKHFYYRPALNELGSISDQQYFRNRYSDIRILEGKLHDETMGCKLLILDHPDTTLNIALAANTPTICFWDPDIWAMCRQAEPFFNDLRAAGVLFDNGEQAAVKVNDIWEDVPGWWNQSDIQSARKRFVDQYARKSANWRWKWIKALWNV